MQNKQQYNSQAEHIVWQKKIVNSCKTLISLTSNKTLDSKNNTGKTQTCIEYFDFFFCFCSLLVRGLYNWKPATLHVHSNDYGK